MYPVNDGKFKVTSQPEQNEMLLSRVSFSAFLFAVPNRKEMKDKMVNKVVCYVIQLTCCVSVKGNIIMFNLRPICVVSLPFVTMVFWYNLHLNEIFLEAHQSSEARGEAENRFPKIYIWNPYYLARTVNFYELFFQWLFLFCNSCFPQIRLVKYYFP